MNTWRRLDGRVVVATAIWAALFLIAAIAVMWWREAPWWLHLSVTGAVVIVVAYEAVRWLKTRYRLTDERIELMSGILFRAHRSIPRQRIRSVDVMAEPISRMLGIARVKIGTGHRVSSTTNAVLSLDALAKPDADWMRHDLIQPTGIDDETTIARIDWKWIKYALLSIWVLALGAGAVGLVYKGLDIIGANPDKEVIPAVIRWLSTVPLAPVITMIVLATLLVGVIGALGLYVEMWWNFRLVREPNGSLRAARGLVVTRSVTLEEERLRGVEVAEPLLLRWGGGAYTYAVATGTGTAEEENSIYNTSALLPPAPLGEAHRVAANVLRESQAPTQSVRLVPHTKLARSRRLRWAVGSAWCFDHNCGAAHRMDLRGRAVSGCGFVRSGRVPQPRARPDRAISGDAPRHVQAPHDRPTPGRLDRLEGQPMGVPPQIRAVQADRDHRGRPRCVSGQGHHHDHRDTLRRRGRSRCPQPVCGPQALIARIKVSTRWSKNSSGVGLVTPTASAREVRDVQVCLGAQPVRGHG
ncbi:PH domain-containing protein [Kibdelosporangium philippinense]|uniref:PH domain-containing protein n=1 Tax=Kibdelosporangium philippinense TaxID=211113 RepID=A0ABS8ZA33_9PSEU|nr:PH domain-containing protein [Kibdelosporangium philippinense]MCE7004716.1 PH domain-containing protein [Kibdelosporangium philippinense]